MAFLIKGTNIVGASIGSDIDYLTVVDGELNIIFDDGTQTMNEEDDENGDNNEADNS